jgi:hypothetical protein
MHFRLATILPLALLLSCSKPNVYQAKINDIPTKSPNYNSEVRFIWQKNPINPYLEIIDFQLVKKGRLSRNQVKRLVEISAIKEGVDAIIEVDYWRESVEKISVLGIVIAILEETEPVNKTVHYTYIQGKGIMYLDNTDYIHKQPEYEYFHQLDRKTNSPTPFFKIEYKLTGQVFEVYAESDEAQDIYQKYFKYYSDFHLLKQREMWSYTMDGSLLKNRKLKNQLGAVVKKCVPEYDKDKRLKRVKIIRYRSKVEEAENIDYAYDEEGKLIKRVIKVHDGAKIYEDYFYKDNRISGKQITIYRSSKEPLVLHSSIDYYDKNYLKDYYFNEYVQTKEK